MENNGDKVAVSWLGQVCLQIRDQICSKGQVMKDLIVFCNSVLNAEASP